MTALSNLTNDRVQLALALIIYATASGDEDLYFCDPFQCPSGYTDGSCNGYEPRIESASAAYTIGRMDYGDRVKRETGQVSLSLGDYSDPLWATLRTYKLANAKYSLRLIDITTDDFQTLSEGRIIGEPELRPNQPLPLTLKGGDPEMDEPLPIPRWAESNLRGDATTKIEGDSINGRLRRILATAGDPCFVSLESIGGALATGSDNYNPPFTNNNWLMMCPTYSRISSFAATCYTICPSDGTTNIVRSITTESAEEVAFTDSTDSNIPKPYTSIDRTSTGGSDDWRPDARDDDTAYNAVEATLEGWPEMIGYIMFDSGTWALLEYGTLARNSTDWTTFSDTSGATGRGIGAGSGNFNRIISIPGPFDEDCDAGNNYPTLREVLEECAFDCGMSVTWEYDASDQSRRYRFQRDAWSSTDFTILKAHVLRAPGVSMRPPIYGPEYCNELNLVSARALGAGIDATDNLGARSQRTSVTNSNATAQTDDGRTISRTIQYKFAHLIDTTTAGSVEFLACADDRVEELSAGEHWFKCSMPYVGLVDELELTRATEFDTHSSEFPMSSAEMQVRSRSWVWRGGAITVTLEMRAAQGVYGAE